MTDSIDSLLDSNTNDAAPAVQENAQADTPEVGVKKPRRRRSAAPRPTEPMYSMAQVAQIMDFASEFDDAPQADRQTFFGIFGWPSTTEADGLQVAQALNDNPADIQAFGLLKELIELLSSGALGFKETIALVGRFGALDPVVLTAFATAVNGVTPAESPIEYNKRIEVADLLGEAVDHLTNLISKADSSERTIKTISWIDELVTTWPGK